MSIVFWKFKFRKHIACLLFVQFIVWSGTLSYYMLTIEKEQHAQRTLIDLFITDAKAHNCSMQKWLGTYLDSAIDHSIFNRQILTRIWEIRDFTDEFIQQQEGKKELDILSSIREYHHALMSIVQLTELNPFERQQIVFTEMKLTRIVQENGNIPILQNFYEETLHPLRLQACAQQMNQVIRDIEERLILALTVKSVCGGLYHIPKLVIQSKKHQKTTNTFAFEIQVHELNRFHVDQAMIGRDTIENDDYGSLKYLLKPSTVGDHTLEGVILKKDGWGRIGKYPFKHRYTVLPK